MSTHFANLIGIIVLSIPILSMLMYYSIIKTYSAKIVAEYSKDRFQKYKDKKVFFKNFDVLKKTRLFYLNPLETLYGFHVCDLIVKDESFMVIGKSKFLAKTINLIPTVFRYTTSVEPKFREVRIINLNQVGKNVEITFKDKNYKNEIVLVIKELEQEILKI